MNQAELSVVSSCILALSPATTNRLLGATLTWATGSDDKETKITKSVVRYTVSLPFSKQALVLRVCSMSLLKTLWEKEKLLIMSNFSFSHSVFYPFGELSAIFIKSEIVVCKLFQFGRV